MTTGAADSTLAKLLGSVRTLYDELLAMRDRAAALRTVEEANAAYRSMLEAEDKKIDALQRQRDAILLQVPASDGDNQGTPSELWPNPRAGRASQNPLPTVSEPPRIRPPSTDRRSIKRLVARYQFHWQLDQSIVAQINTIVDNSDRPLGEALSLLEWRVFEQTAPGESPADHERRIETWHTALGEYRDWLRDEISVTETRYGSVLKIWERWRAAQNGAPDEVRQWTEFIEKARATRQQTIQKLRDEIASLRQSLEEPGT